jgi:hypothetical protein
VCAASSTCPPRSSAGNGSSSHARAADRFGDVEALVGVDHELEGVADGFTHCGEPRDVFRNVRLADLQLGAAKARGLRRQRLFDQRLDRELEPAALRRVERHPALRAARRLPQGQPGAPRLQVPQRRVDGGQRETRDRADGGRVGGEEQVLPDRLDPVRIAADELRRQVIAQQRHHRRAAGADRVAVAGALAAVVAADAHHRRLLRDEGLDRVGAHDLRREVDLQDFDVLYRAHDAPSVSDRPVSAATAR